MNATCFLLSGLMAGADTPPPPVAASAPIVVSTGAGCVGCGSAPVAYAPPPVVYSAANTPCNPCGGQHATLVDWMKAKAAVPPKPGIIARMRAKAAPAPVAHAVVGHAVASSPCGGCGDGVVSAPGIVSPPSYAPGTVIGTPGTVITTPGTTTPGTVITTPGIPKEMPKPKDTPKVDPPKDPPKTGGGTDVPKAIDPPKTGGSGVPKVIEIPKPIEVPKAPGTISIPPLPVTPASGTNSPY